ncbi:hypothetical protein Cp4433_01690 [Clostridium perfringens]|nr:hypothetical protein [Clostridium perfringens]MDH5086782.1 hypothetical protein [Clostridium perfringens]
MIANLNTPCFIINKDELKNNICGMELALKNIGITI